MTDIEIIAKQFNVSPESLKMMMDGVQRRIDSLPDSVKLRMVNDRGFAAEVFQQAVASWHESSTRFFDRYFSDPVYRQQVIEDVYDQIKGQQK